MKKRIKKSVFIDIVLTLMVKSIMKFEWDAKKNEINKAKHGICFEKAKEIFNDPLTLSFLDERFHYLEERWISMGRCTDEVLIVVAHLYYNANGKEVIRIISARKASPKERNFYEKV